MKTFWGKVKKGAQRGKDLGFPTANIPVHSTIEEGIYLSRVIVRERPSTGSGKISSLSKRSASKGLQYNALTFVGKAVTFGETETKAESYLLDFSGNLYGKYITIQLLKKLRDNKKFSLVEDLKKQMNEDLLNAQKFFTK